MGKEIKYIGFYSTPETINTRACSLAAINKMNYISNALNRAEFDVHIISPSWIIGTEMKWRKKIEEVEVGKRVTLCPSFGTKYGVTKIMKVLFSLFWLFCYVLLNTKRDEKILVYHSPWLSIPLIVAKFFRRPFPSRREGLFVGSRAFLCL